jgi:hypothetical protein
MPRSPPKYPEDSRVMQHRSADQAVLPATPCRFCWRGYPPRLGVSYSDAIFTVCPRSLKRKNLDM